MHRFTYGALGIVMLASGVALAKLPPPTPEEQAAAAAKKETKAKQEQEQKAALTAAQDRVAKQYHKEHGGHPSAGAGEQTSTVKLPKNAREQNGEGGPSPDHPFSQEAHSSHTK